MNKDIAKHGFKKGQSGNPKGRPKGALSFKGRLAKYLKAKIDVNGVTMTAFDAVICALIQKAKSGDVAAIKEVSDRIDGKVSQPMELAGAGGMPLTPPTIVINEAVADAK